MFENSPQAAYEFICNVKKDIKTVNRFCVDERMEELIRRYAEEPNNADIIKTGTKLYRARIYKEDDAESRYNELPKSRFKGYGKKDSFVNPDPESINEGRCNPQFISYLYTAKSPECCIYEVRPSRGTYVSVATITVKEELRILQLDKKWQMTDTFPVIVEGALNATLFAYMALEFRRPAKANGDYLFCQYVSEKIKKYKFDGLAFYSSVCHKPKRGEGNVNVVIFSHEKCEATSSRLYKIEEVTLEYK